MSDKIKVAENITTPIVEVVTAGAEKLVKGAPVVVETGSDAVEVMVELVDKTGFLNKKFVIGAAVAVGVSVFAGGLAYWASRRRNADELEEIVEETAHKVVEEMTKPTSK